MRQKPGKDLKDCKDSKGFRTQGKSRKERSTLMDRLMEIKIDGPEDLASQMKLGARVKLSQ